MQTKSSLSCRKTMRLTTREERWGSAQDDSARQMFVLRKRAAAPCCRAAQPAGRAPGAGRARSYERRRAIGVSAIVRCFLGGPMNSERPTLSKRVRASWLHCLSHITSPGPRRGRRRRGRAGSGRAGARR
jgi:hypothetical protein